MERKASRNGIGSPIEASETSTERWKEKNDGQYTEV